MWIFRLKLWCTELAGDERELIVFWKLLKLMVAHLTFNWTVQILFHLFGLLLDFLFDFQFLDLFSDLLKSNDKQWRRADSVLKNIKIAVGALNHQLNCANPYWFLGDFFWFFWGISWFFYFWRRINDKGWMRVDCVLKNIEIAAGALNLQLNCANSTGIWTEVA